MSRYRTDRLLLEIGIAIVGGTVFGIAFAIIAIALTDLLRAWRGG